MTQRSWGFTTESDPAGDATQDVSEFLLADEKHTWIAGARADAGVCGGAYDALLASTPAARTIRVGTGRALVHGYNYLNTAAVDLVTDAVSQNTRRRVVVEHSLTSGDANYKQNRLVIVNGIAGSLTDPALTQADNGIWQIPICAFTVAPSGAISDLTDQRILIGPNVLAIPDAYISTRMLQDDAVTAAKTADKAMGKAQVSDDILRRHDASTWNTVRDMTSTDYTALAAKSTGTFYTVDET